VRTVSGTLLLHQRCVAHRNQTKVVAYISHQVASSMMASSAVAIWTEPVKYVMLATNVDSSQPQRDRWQNRVPVRIARPLLRRD
jgi:hypothetical protein